MPGDHPCADEANDNAVPTRTYRVCDDFNRPIGIPAGTAAIIMALLGDRLDRILFEEDDD
jgi:hypothetical protein